MTNMKIERIDVFHVSMPVRAPFRTAFGTIPAVDSVLIRMVIDGVEGWGEAAPYAIPQYSEDFAAGAFILLRDTLGPFLLGKSVESGAALQDALAPFKGNPFAKSALDTAWWDAFAKRSELPLWKLIGGENPEVPVGADIGLNDDGGALLGMVREAAEQGFQRIKLKFSPASNIDHFRKLREAFPSLPLHIDCNGGFTLSDSKLFETLDDLELAMIEQPLARNDLIDHAALQERLRTPLCLDESITELDKARKAIQIGSCKWINIKIGRVGGLTNAIAIHDYCKAKRIPCWTGGMLESAVGQGASLALATLENMKYPADIFPTERFYEHDLGRPDIRLYSESIVRAPNAPGSGFSPRRGELDRLTIARASIGA